MTYEEIMKLQLEINKKHIKEVNILKNSETYKIIMQTQALVTPYTEQINKVTSQIHKLYTPEVLELLEYKVKNLSANYFQTVLENTQKYLDLYHDYINMFEKIIISSDLDNSYFDIKNIDTLLDNHGTDEKYILFKESKIYQNISDQFDLSNSPEIILKKDKILFLIYLIILFIYIDTSIVDKLIVTYEASINSLNAAPKYVSAASNLTFYLQGLIYFFKLFSDSNK
ncbi:MAG: hypothetical protein ACRC4T_15655 [Cetobacterium sp.]